MKRISVLKFLVKKGECSDEEEAEGIVSARRCVVDGKTILNPKAQVSPDATFKILPESKPVSRARYKLEGALNTFDIDVKDKVCADLGASTGGFTELLLERGAKQVFAVDTAKGELDWKLRSDERVVVMDGVNAASLEELPIAPSLVTIDISLVSLEHILPAVKRFADQGCELLALIKPQYELLPEEVPEGGVVNDPLLHKKACLKVTEFSKELGFSVHGVMESELKGKSGNQEFVLYAALAPSESS